MIDIDKKRTLEDFNLNDAQKIANAIAYALGQQYPGVRFEMTAKEKTPPANQSTVSNCQALIKSLTTKL